MVRFKHRYLLAELIFPQSLHNPFELLPSSSSSSSNNGSSVRSKLPYKTPIPPPILSEGGLINLLKDSLSVNFGDVGAGELNVKYLSPHTNIVMFRVSREHFRTLWAALTLLRKVGGHEVIVKMIHVSGTIRKTQHAAIAYDRKGILEAIKSNSVKSIVATTVSTTGEKEEVVVDEIELMEKRLRESEENIMALEA